MNKKKLSILFIFSLFLFGVYILDLTSQKKDVKKSIAENQSIYKEDKADSVMEVYITVLPLEKKSKKYSYTFKDLNRDINFRDDKEVQVKVLFQEGTDGPPRQGNFGFGLTDANGDMKMRGHSTRNSDNKSYKIDLNKKGGLWHGFETVNLNKHPFDRIKIRNKLSFDYLKKVPGITSLRTQFVHLYIKDYSEEDYFQDYIDFGLFTHVENVDDNFLKNHGFDKKGYLYKVEDFEFFRYPDQIKLKTDEDYDKEIFENVLEIRGNDDHKKLIKMLKDVNNDFIHINKVFEEHFDRENYITWLAVNILFGNIDTNSQNYFLYSPRNNNTWYFLPWDFDGAWGFYDQAGNEMAPWQEGVSNYWGNVLHKRFLKNKDNITDLNRKIEYLTKIFTEDNTEKLLDAYKPISVSFLTSEPDNKSLLWSSNDIEKEFARLPGLIEKNRKTYYENLDKPMPVHMARPINLGTYYIFKWDKSYDFQSDLISYSVDISKSPDFKDIIHHQGGIQDTEYAVNDLLPGKYYWRLGIEDSKGNTQTPFDIYRDKSNKKYFGVQEFIAQ